MIITIEHGRTKREIRGPFNICGDALVLRRIGEQLIEASHAMSYGWVFITEREQPSICNTPPMTWEEAGMSVIPNTAPRTERLD
jgi:hypothetical protein